MVVNNIVVKNSGSYYTITGDVNNAGLEDAKSVTVTTGRAVPSEPYKSYVVGSLEPDGLAEFEVTFTNPEGSAPDLIVDYKDADGNPYQTVIEVNLGYSMLSVSGENTGGDSTPSGIPFGTAAGIAAVLLILGCAVFAWKRGLLSDLRK
jgi:hypothetical protein